MKKMLLAVVACVIILSLIWPYAGSRKILYFETTKDSTKTAKFIYFDGEDVKKVKFTKGTAIVTYDLEATMGDLKFFVRDDDDKLIKNLSEEDGVYSFEVKENGDYNLVVKASKAIGKFKIKYKQ